MVELIGVDAFRVPPPISVSGSVTEWDRYFENRWNNSQEVNKYLFIFECCGAGVWKPIRCKFWKNEVEWSKIVVISRVNVSMNDEKSFLIMKILENPKKKKKILQKHTVCAAAWDRAAAAEFAPDRRELGLGFGLGLLVPCCGRGDWMTRPREGWFATEYVGRLTEGAGAGTVDSDWKIVLSKMSAIGVSCFCLREVFLVLINEIETIGVFFWKVHLAFFIIFSTSNCMNFQEKKKHKPSSTQLEFNEVWKIRWKFINFDLQAMHWLQLLWRCICCSQRQQQPPQRV